ncbi:hypothetical protein Droror1_Dr00024389 [Drosera rotundifolia]
MIYGLIVVEPEDDIVVESVVQWQDNEVDDNEGGYLGTKGEVLDYGEFVKKAHAHGVKVVMATNLLALTLLKPTGELGVDIIVGIDLRQLTVANMTYHVHLLYRERESEKSGAADMLNTRASQGDAITAALFLKQFVDEKVQLMHINMAGPVWNDKKRAATGFGVSTLDKWVLKKDMKLMKVVLHGAARQAQAKTDAGNKAILTKSTTRVLRLIIWFWSLAKLKYQSPRPAAQPKEEIKAQQKPILEKPNLQPIKNPSTFSR